MARTLEQAGFASLWVSDHVVLPERIGSRYPFAADGRATWATDTPYFDAVVALALIAAATERASFGTAVLVLPLRNPVVFAKQAASLDVVSGGRLRLGVGAGWLKEEFDALGVDVRVARAAARGVRSRLLRESLERPCPRRRRCRLPTPAHAIPVLRRRALEAGAAPGGAARRRLARPAVAGRARPRRDRARAGSDGGAGRRRDPAGSRSCCAIVDAAGRSDELARRLPELARAGVDEVIVDVDWAAGDPAADFERWRAARREPAGREDASPSRAARTGSAPRSSGASTARARAASCSTCLGAPAASCRTAGAPLGVDVRDDASVAAAFAEARRRSTSSSPRRESSPAGRRRGARPRRVGRGVPRQRPRDDLDAQARAPSSRRRRDRRDRVAQLVARRPEHRRLRREQARRARHRPLGGARPRPARHPRQRDRARADRDRGAARADADARARARRSRSTMRWRAPRRRRRSAGWRRSTTSPAPRSSSRAISPRASPGT